MALQRASPEPRSVLGAPLILANKDRLVIQIVQRKSPTQKVAASVLTADGMTGESRQKSHENAQVQNLDRFWALPLFSPTRIAHDPDCLLTPILANKDLPGG